MANYLVGEDAFNAPIGNDSGGSADWSKLNSGMSYKVRVFKNYTQAVMKFRNYGIYKVVNSFSAKVPSIKDSNGFASENLTPWDKASDYYAKLMFAAKDAGNEADEKKHKQEAGKYREKERYAVAFIDLDTGLPVHFDISPNQWQVIKATMQKYAANLQSIPFELSKTGAGTKTVVSFTPIMTQLEPLTDKQQTNFDNHVETEFDPNVFAGFMYEIDEAEQIQLLVQSGFDVSLIGLSAQSGSGEESTQNTSQPDADSSDIEAEELPF